MGERDLSLIEAALKFYRAIYTSDCDFGSSILSLMRTQSTSLSKLSQETRDVIDLLEKESSKTCEVIRELLHQLDVMLLESTQYTDVHTDVLTPPLKDNTSDQKSRTSVSSLATSPSEKHEVISTQEEIKQHEACLQSTVDKLRVTKSSVTTLIQETSASRPNLGLKITNRVLLTSGLILRVGSTYIEVKGTDSELTLHIIQQRLPAVVRLPIGDYALGRQKECVVHIKDHKVSMKHGAIKYQDSAWTYIDTASRNGSWLLLHTVESICRNMDSPAHEVTEASVLCDNDNHYLWREVSRALLA
jgi:hypothetical protein